MRSAVLELEPGADDEVFDSARGDHLPGLRGRHHARGEMHGDSCEIAGRHLALAGMDAGTNLKPDRARGGAERERTPHRPGGAVEGCQHTVAGPLHEPTAVARQLSLDEPLVLAEQLAPTAVSELGRVVG